MRVLITRAKCKTVQNMELALARELHMAGIARDCHDSVGFVFSQGTPGCPFVKPQQSVGTGKVEVPQNAVSWGHHVPCSA